MKSEMWPREWGVIALVALVKTSDAIGAVSVTTLFSFNGTNGSVPEATLSRGADGWLYGTTIGGGTNEIEIGGRGTIFCLSTNSEFKTLHHFDDANGSNPQSGLTQGKDGNFYGVTDYGGSQGGGVFYRITPDGTYAPLASFGWTNGAYPHGVTSGLDGCFYGTTIHGGTNAESLGTVYKVSTNGIITSLVSFHGTNGAYPQSGLLRAADGSLYGTTVEGGTNGGWGTVFKLTPEGSFMSIVFFNGTNGARPGSMLVQDAERNILGTTSAGGAGFDGSAYSGNGTVFKIAPNDELKTLHYFQGYPTDGSRPMFGGLCPGPNRSFYGTTELGGTGASGTVFQVDSDGATDVLYSFSRPDFSSETNLDGAEPFGGLVLADDGCFYGTTTRGGVHGLGTLFRLAFLPEPLVISISRSSTGLIELTWNAVIDSTYQIQSNVGLEANAWSNSGAPLLATNQMATVCIAIAPESGCYYRVVQLPSTKAVPPGTN